MSIILILLNSISFFQYWPVEGAPSESTEAILWSDSKSIYVNIKCYYSPLFLLDKRITPRDKTEGDEVSVILDPMNTEEWGYKFTLNAAGVQSDAFLSNDGRNQDKSWDGVWYSKTKITDWGWKAEFKIPFKTLRYNPKDTIWGIIFTRKISKKDEYDSYPSLKREEGIRLSRAEKIIVHTKEKAYHIEISPVGLIRSEHSEKVNIHGGFDFVWLPLTNVKISFTINPDFAQIEADPYKINLSKYELYFSEKRPFFTSDASYFTLPEKDFIIPFYSRRIGKKLPDGKEVPILGSGKFTGTFGEIDIGCLGAITEEIAYTDWDGKTKIESKTFFEVLRIKKRVYSNSTIGFFYAGMQKDSLLEFVNVIDASYRRHNFEWTGFIARDNCNEYGGITSMTFTKKDLMISASFKDESNNFDIEKFGWSPYQGYKEINMSISPRYYNMNIFRIFAPSFDIVATKEKGEPGFQKGLCVGINSGFYNLWGFYIGTTYWREYELNQWYKNIQTTFWFWTDASKPFYFNIGLSFNTNEYNYRRGYIGPYLDMMVYTRFIPSSQCKICLNFLPTIEWKPDKTMEEKSWILRPSMEYFFTKDLSLRFYAEPNTDTHIHYFSGLLSWNFRPKSWFYLAYNEERDNTEGNWGLRNRILVAKIRYLFFW